MFIGSIILTLWIVLQNKCQKSFKEKDQSLQKRFHQQFQKNIRIHRQIFQADLEA